MSSKDKGVGEDEKRYLVGYKRPPMGKQFPKGKSGNPKGRPKGSRNKVPIGSEERLMSILVEEAYRPITVRDGEGSVTVPMAQAIVRSMAVNAAKGNHRSQRLFSELLAAKEREDRRRHLEWLETAIEYKAQWELELERRAHFGTSGPEPIPHPDQIEINMRTGEVSINGPMTHQAKRRIDEMRQRKADFEDEARWLRQEIAISEDSSMRARMEDDLRHAEHMLAIIRQVVP